jgi:putative membrane protein
MTDGTRAPDLAGVLSTWTWSPVADALIVLAVVGYLCAAIRYRRIRRTRWPAQRGICWMIGALFAVVSINGALAIYGRNLLWVHMIVHLIMITVIPAFVVWAQPIRLLQAVGGVRAGRAILQLGHNRLARWSVTPWFTVPLYAVVLVGTHLTGFQQSVPHHIWLRDAELGLYLLSGYLLLLPIVGGELAPLRLAPLLRFAVLVLCMAPDTLVGVVLMLTRTASAPAYSADRVWGPNALADQSIAGAVMWWGGDGLMMILMLVVTARWVRNSDGGSGLGSWLDAARRQTLLGNDAVVDVDGDAAALEVYNARLAELHGLASRQNPALSANASRQCPSASGSGAPGRTIRGRRS